MQANASKPQNPVAARLRPVVYLYAAFNVAVAVLLFSTVSPTLATDAAREIASLR
ncbi:MAG: hypothetical protein J0H80_16120 [Rhizobiales bacterium]|nr:hypothetical protein [Hyphomicrobiales bacterium]